MKKHLVSVLLFYFISVTLFSQAPHKPTSGEIFESIQKLNFLGSVLYVAAHPDDENTNLIAYFANDVKAETAYLSLTRGDGGQNLIGPELRELLGIIRTEELLEARKIDGGIQFFTRANDFGYSKNPDETLQIWDKKEVLNDIVSVIRRFQPDVIINRFDHRTSGTTHGHHTASAMLSVEAFDLAQDSSYKTHLQNDEVWTPKRLFFNTSWWFYGSRENFEKADKSKLLSLEIGSYYPIKGLSNNEIASLSRSKHKSQGFGTTGNRGEYTDFLEFLKGDFPSSKSVFDGIDTSWNRVEGGEEIGVLITKIEKEFDFEHPEKSINPLLKAYQLIDKLKDSYWKRIKLKEIKEVIANCAGIYLEATTNESSSTLLSENTVKIEAINRSDASVILKEIKIEPINSVHKENSKLINNHPFKNEFSVKIPANANETSPYWVRKKGTLGMYYVADESLIGFPETPRYLKAEFVLEINGVQVPLTKDIVFKYNNPVDGEMYKPFEILPEISASFQEKVIVFTNNNSQKITVKLKATKDNLKGNLSLCIPENWQIVPQNKSFQLLKKGEEQSYTFEVFPPENNSEGLISPIVEIDRKTFTNEIIEINHNHIPFQSVVMPSEAKLVRLNIAIKGNLVGYIQGAGDEIPDCLRQMGYTVVELDENDITSEKIKNFDAIVLGIRIYNTNPRSKFYQKELFDYVKNGGTLITQYNTNFRLEVENVAPFPLKLSRDRVTDENSEVFFVNPQHEMLNFPNKITQHDFDGWVQERGLYFPNEWSNDFETVLSMNDNGETPKTGSLLVAKYGKGNFVYTGLSFFRELPAGVPGAYKLFANMISIGKNNYDKPLKH